MAEDSHRCALLSRTALRDSLHPSRLACSVRSLKRVRVAIATLLVRGCSHALVVYANAPASHSHPRWRLRRFCSWQANLVADGFVLAFLPLLFVTMLAFSVFVREALAGGTCPF